MAGFSFSSATSSSSLPFSLSSSAGASSSPFFSSSNPASSFSTPTPSSSFSTTTPSSSPFSFAFSNPNSAWASTPSSSPFGNFSAVNTISSSASTYPTPFAFASSTETASSTFSPLFGSSSSGLGFTSGLFGSGSSASTACSTGLPLFGAASLGSSAATSSLFGFGSSTSSSASGPTNIFGLGSGASGSIFGSTASSGSGSCGSIFGSTAASSAFGSSALSPASAFGAASSSSTLPFPSGTSISLAGTSSGCSAFCLTIGLVDEEEEAESEGEQVREESTLEQPPVQINDCETNHDECSRVGQDHAGKSECVKDVGGVEQDCESSAVACSTTIHVEELEAIPTAVPEETILLRTSSVDSAPLTGDTANIWPPVEDMGKQQPSKDIAEGQEETSENLSVVSGVVGDEAGVSNAVDQAFCIFTHSAGLNNLSPSDAQLIIKSILDKHGDITKGSIVKSLVLRSTLMQVVAEVVHRLCNNTMNTLGSDELQLMQRLADDAAAVGFSVDWLQERLTKVSKASKYHEYLVHLERLGERINATKKSVMEMELQQLVWKKEVDCMKVELEGIDFEGSNLGEGLI